MSRVCETCGKRTQRGKRITTRGKAKHLGGVGTKVTGIRLRTYKPNLQKVRAMVNGTAKRLTLCTRCLRRGRAVKRPVRTPAAPSVQ
ncbi:MAG: 50S ribosomal protein L28 [Planctomycetota bacterium]